MGTNKDLEPTKEERYYFDRWVGDMLWDTKYFPGCTWRNMIRALREELMEQFIAGYRRNEVLQYQCEKKWGKPNEN